MKLNITLSDLLTAISIIISVISLYLSYINKKNQQNLKKELQQNEFNFSRKKIWYEKQNEIIDITMGKLADNFLNLSEMSFYRNQKRNLLKDGFYDLVKQTKLFDKMNRNEDINTINEINREIDNLIDEKEDQEIKRKLKAYDKEIGIRANVISQNVSYLKRHTYYFSESIERKTNFIIASSQKILSIISEDIHYETILTGEDFQKDKVEESLDSIKKYTKEIRDELREDFLYL